MLTAEGHLHWQGIMFVGASVIVAVQSIQAYLIDAFTLHAASGTVSAMRSVFPCLHIF